MEAQWLDDTVHFYPIATGKLRRYWSWSNFVDIFKLSKGICQAWVLLGKIKPEVVYSKGGYVSVPVICAAWVRRVPVVIHESDVTPGLASRIGAKVAKVICTSFSQTKKYFSGKRVVHTGLPLRDTLNAASLNEGYRITGFTRKLPVLMIIGGSLGAQRINEFVWRHLPDLLPHMQIIHITGKGKSKAIDWNTLFFQQEADLHNPSVAEQHSEEHARQISLQKRRLQEAHEQWQQRYQQYEFLTEEYAHLLSTASVVISRAGATSIFELAKMKKPTVFIPLGTDQSRGDQVINAEILDTQGAAITVTEEELTKHPEAVAELLTVLATNRERQEILKQRIQKFYVDDACERVIREIQGSMRT